MNAKRSKSSAPPIAVIVLAALATLCVVGVAAARSSDSAGGAPLTDPELWSDDAPWSSADVATVLTNIKEEARAAAPLEQAMAFEDGVVTKEEYRAAMSSTFACATAAGVNLQNIGEMNGGLFVSYSYVDDEGAHEAFEACYLHHARWIDSTWQITNERAVFEQDRAVVECLRSAEVDVSRIPHPVTGEPTDGSKLPLDLVLLSLSGDEFVAGRDCLHR